MPEFSISGSGSVSVNSLSNETKAVVDNAVISLNDGDMSVTARDNAFVGAYSGAAALVWKSSGEMVPKERVRLWPVRQLLTISTILSAPSLPTVRLTTRASLMF